MKKNIIKKLPGEGNFAFGVRRASIWISSLQHSNKGRWIIGIAVALLLFGLLAATRPIFLFRHDSSMMRTYSGYRTGFVTNEHAFGNMMIGSVMAFLYNITRAVPWYAIYVVFIAVLSSAVICRSLLTAAHKRGLSAAFSLAVYAVLYTIGFMGSSANFLFTTNAAMVSCASCAMLYTAYGQESKRARVFDFALSGFLLLLSSFIRFTSFRAGVCFWLLLHAYFILSGWLREKKSVKSGALKIFLQKKYMARAVFIMGVIALCFAGSMLNEYLHNVTSPEGFREYNSLRVEYYDYPVVSYDEAPELYESLGWSRAFTDLTLDSYFIDDKFTNEALQTIIDYSDSAGATKSNTLGKMIALGVEVCVNTDVGFSLTLALLAGAALLFFIAVSRKGRYSSGWLLIWCGTAAIGLAVIQCVFLCYNGRFLDRAYQCAALPAITVLALVLQELCPDEFSKKNGGFDSLRKAMLGGKQRTRFVQGFFCLSIAAVLFAAQRLLPKILHPQSTNLVILSRYSFAIFIVALGFAALGLYIAAEWIREFWKERKRERPAGLAVNMMSSVLAAVLLLTSASIALGNTYNGAENKNYERQSNIRAELVQYAMDNPDDIILMDASVSSDYRLVLNAAKESEINLLRWGATEAFQNSYFDQLESLGVDKLDTESFFEDNVYYATSSRRGETFDNFIAFLRESHNDALPVFITSLPNGADIYKIADGQTDDFHKGELRRCLYRNGITDELLSQEPLPEEEDEEENPEMVIEETPQEDIMTTYEKMNLITKSLYNDLGLQVEIEPLKNANLRSVEEIVEITYPQYLPIVRLKYKYRSEILKILQEINPDIDYEFESDLINSQMYSYDDVLTAALGISEKFDMQIGAKSITKSNFRSLNAMTDFVYREKYLIEEAENETW